MKKMLLAILLLCAYVLVWNQYKLQKYKYGRLRDAEFSLVACHPGVNWEGFTVYGSMTQTGIVAERKFQDPSGRVSKKIFYEQSGASSCVGAREEDLVPRWIETYEYDDEGRLKRTVSHEPDMTEVSITDQTYSDMGNAIIERRLDDGTRYREYRANEKSGHSDLYFDRTGEVVIGIGGAIPADIEFSPGWGDPVDGFACALGVDRAQGRLNDINFVVSVQKIAASPHNDYRFDARNIRFELRDESGHLVQDRKVAWNIDFTPRIAKTYTPGHFPLGELFSKVSAGTYYFTVRLRSDDSRIALVSRPVKLQIIAEE